MKNDKSELRKNVLGGKIFIYPTDTIYGIGCNALDEDAVERIRQLKQRDLKPFSVIAPSFKWIEENLIVDCDLNKYLPGRYTLVLKKKNPGFLKWVSPLETLGVRIPNNEFCFNIQKFRVPFITTSVNLSGQKPITEIAELTKEIREKVDLIVDVGKLNGSPSTLVIGGKEIKR